MNKLDTYKAVFTFLNEIWKNNKEDFKDDLPGLLGDMCLLQDGGSADPAVFIEWKEIATDNDTSAKIVYEHMLTYLRKYAVSMNSDELFELIVFIGERQEQWQAHLTSFDPQASEVNDAITFKLLWPGRNF